MAFSRTIFKIILLGSLFSPSLAISAYVDTDTNCFASTCPTIDKSMVTVNGVQKKLIDALDAVPISAQSFGLVGDGVASNTAAWARLAAATNNPTVRFTKGTYLLDCTATYSMASSISLISDGAAILKMPSGCSRAGGSNLFFWTAKPNVTVRGLTIDLNNMVVTGTSSTLFAPLTLNGGDNPVVDSVRIINGSARMNLVAVVGSSEIKRYTITNNYFHLTAPSIIYNQCILVSVPSSFPVAGGLIQGNTCANTALSVGGSNTLISGNDVYGWAYGSGIYSPQGTLHHHLQVTGNSFHDGAASPGLDENATPSHGVEVHAWYSIISGNNIYNNGGSGIISFSKYGKLSGNKIYGNGKRVDTHVGFGIFAAWFTEANNGNYTTITDNYVHDDGSGNQVEAYFEMDNADAAGGGPRNLVYGNDFDGPTAKMALNPLSQTTTSPPDLVQTKLAVMTEGGSYSFPTPQVGGHFHLFLSAAGVISDYSLVLPACDVHSDGAIATLSMITQLNGLAVTAASGAVNYSPGALNGGQSAAWICRGASTAWFPGPGSNSPRTAGKAPVVSSCGTSPGAVSGNSRVGRVVWGTGSPTSCTLTFSDAPWTTTPKCNANVHTPVAVGISSTSTTAVTFALSPGLSSAVMTYRCDE